MQGGSMNMRKVQSVAISIHAKKNADLCNDLSGVSKGCRGMAVRQERVL